MCKRKLILSRILSRFGVAVDGVRQYICYMAINSPEYFQAQCSESESSWNMSQRTSIIQNITYLWIQ
jgi:hypothetical protein